MAILVQTVVDHEDAFRDIGQEPCACALPIGAWLMKLFSPPTDKQRTIKVPIIYAAEERLQVYSEFVKKKDANK